MEADEIVTPKKEKDEDTTKIHGTPPLSISIESETSSSRHNESTVRIEVEQARQIGNDSSLAENIAEEISSSSRHNDSPI